MCVSKPLLKNFRENLSALIAGSYTQAALNETVAVCHALAGAFLKSKLATGRLNINLLGLNCHELGYDCIPELFQRDNTGNFVQLKAYFDGVAFDSVSDEELLAHLRCLVFSKVNQSIPRWYSEADPALSRILRNVKGALYASGRFREVERFGETYIAPKRCDTLEHLPDIDFDFLESQLSQMLEGNECTPDLLSKLCLYLSRQNEYSRLVPLVSVAAMFRSLFSQACEILDEETGVDGKLLVDEVLAIVRRICDEIRRQVLPRYVARKKAAEETLEKYFIVVEHYLHEKLVGEDATDCSLFERLEAILPGLTHAEYLKKHRNILEYLTKLARKRCIRILRERYGPSDGGGQAGAGIQKLE